MKISLKPLLFAFTASVVLFSCSKKEDLNRAGSNSANDKKTQNSFADVDTAGFMEDELTEAFILKSTEVKHSSVDTALINSLIADDTITESEMNELASSLGFDSESQFSNYLMDLENLKSQLNNKYNLSGLDPTIVEYMFKQAMASHLYKLARQLTPKGPAGNQPTFTCAETFVTCTSGAYAFEATGLTACNAGDILPPVAALCFASVVTATYYMLDGCQNDYDNCNDNPSATSIYLVKAVNLTFYNNL